MILKDLLDLKTEIASLWFKECPNTTFYEDGMIYIDKYTKENHIYYQNSYHRSDFDMDKFAKCFSNFEVTYLQAELDGNGIHVSCMRGRKTMKRFEIELSKNILPTENDKMYTFIVEVNNLKEAEAIRFSMCSQHQCFGSVKELENMEE